MNKRKLGEEKEALALSYLQTQGFFLLEKNFRCKVGEIDLIGKDKDTLVFVEVKYRRNAKVGTPEEAVGFRKQRTIRKVAEYYLLTHFGGYSTPCRFDVVAIEGQEIRYYPGAF